MHLIALSQPTTLEALLRKRVAGLPIATLALINQVEPLTPLAAGQIEKWVTGQPAP